jgi:hypothetical protein
MLFKNEVCTFIEELVQYHLGYPKFLALQPFGGNFSPTLSTVCKLASISVFLGFPFYSKSFYKL